MEDILTKIKNPEDLKKLNIDEKNELAKQIRKMILDTVSTTGGHLASNLGVVELTIAIHSIFNTPDDKIIWDVGHQCYTHKILTGRRDKFATLRQLNGLSGFPKTCESEYDSFDTGHSSTSISIATGMARARTIQGKNYQVVAVIGDGSLTGGMALEALNDAGSSKTNVTVILNDNEMSISKNVGGIPLLLSKIRTKKVYKNSNKKIKRATLKIPYIGKKIVKFVQKIKKVIMQLIIPNMFFEDIGFTYLGPVDGHNIEQLENVLERSKRIKGPVLVHVMTRKGKGYKIAEETPENFHGVSSFDINTGKPKKIKSKDYSKVFGDKMIQIANKNSRIVAVTAAMKDGTGLKEFSEKFPDRFFDVGIAEQHAVGLIAGMAKAGMKPVFAVYSSFLQRSYDQLIHDIAIQKLPAVICIDRAGIVGNDGETHQGLFDLAFLSTIPNIVIMSPKNFKEFESMLDFSIEYDGPIAIRYPRGGEEKVEFNREIQKVKLGKAEIIRKGKDATIIAIGKMVGRALKIANKLEEKNISIEVINSRFLNPLDEELVIKSAKKTKRIITIEDGIVSGGLGSKIIETINNNELQNIKIKSFGYKTTFIEHGTVEELEQKYNMSVDKILDEIEKWIKS